MAKPNFFNDNENRAFPFKAWSVGVRTPASGPVSMRQLPDDFIVDCGFIMGPESGFDSAVNKVYLEKITKVTDTIISFEFKSDSSALADYPLTFLRTVSDKKYKTDFQESDIPVTSILDQSQSESFSVVNDVECGEPFWSGYLTTGNMQSIADRLTSIGDSITRVDDSDSVVEPALIQNLNDAQLVSLNIVNEDRTRAIKPSSCDQYEWNFQLADNFVNYVCLQGDIRLAPGYNISISQNVNTNTLQFSPTVNAGKGKPCEELKLFDQETSPLGSENELLGGDFYCNEAIRTINGLQGPNITLFAGNGVAITANQENNEVLVDLNLIDLALCTYSEVSESI